MLRPERSIEHVEISGHMRKTSINNSVDEVSHDVNPFLTGMTSPQGPSGKHYDHILPKSLNGGGDKQSQGSNARTTVNFFKSSVNQTTAHTAYPPSGISRDSHRGLGGGWNGQVMVDNSEGNITSPQRAPSGNRSITEIPGLTYLQVKVRFYLLTPVVRRCAVSYSYIICVV
jgi:hypothetical protein